jgi:hypothetical protein
MNLDSSTYSVADLQGMLARKDLIVNKSYQRESGLWPSGARSYFIDTVLTQFPFPKLYFSETLDRTTRKVVKEIVDGQQRFTTIIDFINNKFRLTSVSKLYAGFYFSDLPEDVQLSFLAHPVPVDVIRNASKSDILEMFRRMNAYTLPLNEAEKRHAQFHGPFKWFVNRLTDDLAATFVNFNILSNRQIVRMADAELITEMVLSLRSGVISTSPKLLTALYQENDEVFDKEVEYDLIIREFFDFIAQQLSDFKNTYLMKSYTIHTLFCACVHNKIGLPGLQAEIGLDPIGNFFADIDAARDQLRELSSAHETKDYGGVFMDYVLAVEGATTRKPSRLTRVKFLVRALRGELAV